MMLYEEGHFLLSDPISKYIPEFKDMQVLVTNDKGASEPYTLVPATREITIRHLLTHTSGLTYGFFGRPYIADLYKEAGISDGLTQTAGTIEEGVKKLAALPLISQPGEAFEYGLSTDVLGYFVEVVSGMTFDTFLRRRLFEPLGMKDAYFFVPPEKQNRLATVYTPNETNGIKRLPEDEVTMGPVVFSTSYHYKGPRTYHSGGAGLVSTAMDYARFLQMLLNGGELDGVRILSPKTVELMTVDHLSGMNTMNRATDLKFSLGFAVSEGPGATGQIGSVGSYSWGGFFNTSFWADPEEELSGVIMTQRYPGTSLGKFTVMVYQAIVK
jgi:CubicO group peptidase (beta-lactamase class C family)